MLSNAQIRLVETWQDAQDFLAWMGQERSFLGLDIETTGLNVGRDIIRMVQFGDRTGAWALPHRNWRGLSKQVIEEYRGPIVAHNLLFEQKFLKKDGIHLPQVYGHDSMIMGHLLNPMSRMDLKGLATKYVDKRAKAGQDQLALAFSGGGWDWATIPEDHPSYWIYAALDTILCSALADAIWPEVRKFSQSYETELACIHVLRDAELAGMLTDPDYRALATVKLTQELQVLGPQIPVNPNSDKQVREYLLGIGCRWTKRAKSGKNLSTDDEVLEFLAGQGYQVAELIKLYRQKTRFLTNYFEKFDDLGVDNVLHPCTRPVGARTGRMSITDPPLQTLPRGRVVRDAFIAREGCDIVLADYEQMELRVMASDADETSMLEAIRRGEDLHDFVATNAYGPGFTKAQRQICKNAQFAKIYGAGAAKFALTAKIDVGEAEAFLARYDELFPGIARRQQEIISGVRVSAGRKKVGYVETVDGRHLPVETDEAYKAVNYRIQGSCGYVLKNKIVELDNAGLGEFFRLPVHDELVFETPHDLTEDVRHEVHRIMPDVRTFKVPLSIDSKVVPRWGEAYPEYDAYVPEYFQEAA